MTPFQALVLLLYAAAAGAACARRSRRGRPVAAYLAAVVLLDVLRWCCSGLLADADVPREGWALAVRHVDQTAYLAGILALPAMAVALFLRRPPWALVAPWAALSVLVALSYPGLSDDALLELYAAVELAGLLASVGCFVMWLGSRRVLVEATDPAIWSGLALMSAVGASALIPRLAGSLLAGWTAAVAAQATILACVLGLQLWRPATGPP